MKFNGATIKRVFLGGTIIAAGYIGVTMTGDDGNAGAGFPPQLQHPLYDEVGDWATSSLAATVYAPALVEPVFDVTDYGAVANDGQNDTAAIRAALDACEAAEGGTVYIPAGTYECWADDAQDAAFYLLFGNLVIEGDGPTETILNFRAFDGADPADDMQHRGNMFTTFGAPLDLANITLRGFRATGNAPPTDNAGAVGLDDGWDTWHKGVAVFYPVENFVIEDSEWDNWRGEALYGGGSAKNIVVRRCLVRGVNASAVSMGGLMLIEDSEIYNVLNGTECFAFGDEGMIVRNCIIDPDRRPEGAVDVGEYGVVHIGFPTGYLTVEDNQIGKCTSAVFLSEMASNVIIRRNTIADASTVYAAFQNQYNDSGQIDAAEDTWVDWLIQDNDVTASTTDIPFFMYGNISGQTDWVIDGNTVTSTGESKMNIFYGMYEVGGTFTFIDNVIADAIASQAYDGQRATWTTNTTTGDYADGTWFVDTDSLPEADPWVIYPSWPKVNVVISSFIMMTRMLEIDSTKLADYPTGFQVEIRRTGANSTIRGIEIKPDADWNTLTDGYMIYDGAVLVLQKGAGGKFEFSSYTPPTVGIKTWDQNAGDRISAADIAVCGQTAVNLSPSVSHTFSTFSGVAIGKTVTLNLNANVTLDHTAGVIEMSTGVDYVSSGTVALSATRAADGTLEVTIP